MRIWLKQKPPTIEVWALRNCKSATPRFSKKNRIYQRNWDRQKQTTTLPGVLGTTLETDITATHGKQIYVHLRTVSKSCVTKRTTLNTKLNKHSGKNKGVQECRFNNSPPRQVDFETALALSRLIQARNLRKSIPAFQGNNAGI